MAGAWLKENWIVFVLPGMVGLFAFILAMIGASLASDVRLNQFGMLVWFSVGSLILMHVVYFACKDVATDKSLRAIDYIYLGMAFFGLTAVIDVQVNLQRAHFQSNLQFYLDFVKSELKCGGLMEPDILEVCSDIEKGELSNKSIETVTGLVPSPDEQNRQNFRRFGLGVREDSRQMRKLAFSIENALLTRRLIGFYILVVALSLRLTRVTAELKEWHLPKKS